MALSVIKLTNVSGGTEVENEIGLLNLNRLVDNSGAVDNFVKGFSDAFTDETGVDTSNSTVTYEGTGDTYANPENESITDIGTSSTGWSGDTSNWSFGINGGDGVESSESSLGGNVRTAIYTTNSLTSSGEIVKFKKNNSSSINGFVGIYEEGAQSHIGTTGNRWGAGIFSSSSSHWANGNPSSQNACGFLLGGSNISAYNPGGGASSSVSLANTAVVTLHRESDNSITVKIDGTTNSTLTDHLTKSISTDWRVVLNSAGEGNNIDLDYIQVRKSDGTFGAGTLLTTAQTASAAPDTIRVVIIGKETDTQTINTDTVFSVSRDGGTTFTNVTVSEAADYNSSGVKIYVGSADVSSQPSGTSLKLKMTTTAAKRFTIHGYSILYR